MSTKPWDSLLAPVEPVKREIKSGAWITSRVGAGLNVRIARFEPGKAYVYIGQISPCEQGVRGKDAREISQFFAELADQLDAAEGKT